MNIKEANKQFKETLKRQGRSPSTIIAYQTDIEQLSNFEKKSGKEDVAEITTEDIQAFLESLKPQFTKKTISRKINSIKTFFRFLISNHLIKNNAAESIQHPRFKNPLPRVLTRMEYRALRDASRKDMRNYTIVELLLQTGIRIGELARLSTQDYDLKGDEPKIHIKGYASNPGREVPLNQAAQSALQNFLQYRGDNENPHLFLTKNNNPLLVRNIRTSIMRAFKAAGIKDAKVNDLRNTFIVYQLKNGMPVERVAQIVGHKRTTTTEKYLKLVKGKKRRKSYRVTEL